MTGNKTTLLERIVRDPNILAGKPTIRGTRVSVAMILNVLAHGATFAEILDDYPYLVEDDLKAALLYAESHINHSEARALAS
jgi:uncharacterized protein (DUF433 family)